MEGRGCVWGMSSHCAGLHNCWREGDLSGVAPAARGCTIEGGRRLYLGRLPLHGASGLMEGRGSFWGCSHCAGLHNSEREDRGCIWGGSHCTGLPD